MYTIHKANLYLYIYKYYLPQFNSKTLVSSSFFNNSGSSSLKKRPGSSLGVATPCQLTRCLHPEDNKCNLKTSVTENESKERFLSEVPKK